MTEMGHKRTSAIQFQLDGYHWLEQTLETNNDQFSDEIFGAARHCVLKDEQF
jgi:hypothetical protein